MFSFTLPYHECFVKLCKSYPHAPVEVTTDGVIADQPETLTVTTSTSQDLLLLLDACHEHLTMHENPASFLADMLTALIREADTHSNKN